MANSTVLRHSAFIPSYYTLHLEPDLRLGSSNHFHGSETITLTAVRTSSSLVLNSKGLAIKNVLLECSGVTKAIPNNAVHYNPSPESETATFNLGQRIKKGETIRLSLDFSGRLGTGKGFYKSTYQGRNGKPALLASTQFEPADAREAFPCIDHPAAKATFGVSITLDKHLDAISNMEAVSIKKVGSGKRTVVFATTPRMSTYLLYFGIGEFDYLEGKLGKIRLRVATTPGKARLGRFAMAAAKKFLAYYQDYFGIPYPLKKLDFIAVPDFTSGAMENWGAITFREDALLLDEKKASLRDKQRVATTISHELVHQWFGNLVTMQWWNDLWLNESFADVMAYKAVDAHYPEFEVWSSFLAGSASRAYHLDSLNSTHPINVNVRTAYEAEEVFDEISYSKGGMVLRMIEHYLGESVFRKGLHHYLSSHQYQNTTGKDLWDALSAASGKPVAAIAQSWTDQPGLPVLDVKEQHQHHLHHPKIAITQQRFLYINKNARKKKALWRLPLFIVDDTLKHAPTLMATASTTISFPIKQRWIKVNAGEASFVRVKYGAESLARLGQAVKKKELSAVDRWGLHNSLFALCLSGDASLPDYLQFVQSYHYETNYLVLRDVMDSLAMIELLCHGEKFFPEIAAQNIVFYRAVLRLVGKTPKKGEKETSKDLRAAALRRLGRLDDPEALAMAAKMFTRPDSIPSDLRDTAYTLAAWQGGMETYRKLWKMYQATDDSQEKRRILPALACFKDERVLCKALDDLLSSSIRQQNRVFLFMAFQSNPYGRLLLWPWMKKNWEQMRKLYSTGFTNHINSVIKGFSMTADPSIVADLRATLRKRPILGTARALDQCEEMTKVYNSFVQRARTERKNRRS